MRLPYHKRVVSKTKKKKVQVTIEQRRYRNTHKLPNRHPVKDKRKLAIYIPISHAGEGVGHHAFGGLISRGPWLANPGGTELQVAVHGYVPQERG